jgi:TfoX/Sxy family transcriptional regulator of competence genes
VLPPPGGSGFGRSALRYHGKIFAMLVRGQLVVKLPASQVDALVAAGHGQPFDASKGIPMKEWFSLDADSELAWPPLAREALAFARQA